jgi:hypothetical protein
VKWLGLLAGNIYLSLDCTPPPGEPTIAGCIEVNPAPAFTTFNVPDLATLTLPGKSSETLLCHWQTPIVNYFAANNTGSPQTFQLRATVTYRFESPVLDDYVFVDRISGFDVSRFSQFAAMKLPIHGTMTDWTRLSADVELVRVDLTARRHECVLQTLSIPVLADGTATGIVQWMHVDLAEGVAFENHPDGYTDGGWLQILHHFPQPIQVRAGETLDLAVGHDRVTLIVQPLAVAHHAAVAMVG